MAQKYFIKKGEQYGRWTVLECGVFDPNSKAQRKVKKCLCECSCEKHTQRYLTPYQLVTGKSQSCGCLHNELLAKRNMENSSVKIGNKYGKLTVIADLGLRKQKSRNKNERWSLCQCDCGSLPIEVRNNELQSGWKKSCGCLSSYGEFRIKQILQENNVNFAQQYSFSDLRTEANGVLKFDFAIFKDNKLSYLIEFDGRQHYEGFDNNWSQAASLETIQHRDNLKNEYCKKNNIILKRIPYFDLTTFSYEDIISEKYNI